MRRLLLLVVATLVVLPAQAARDEYEVKAAFLLNFARLVAWPAKARPDAEEPIVVSVVGDARVERGITAGIGGTQVGSHPVLVRGISAAEEIAGSHILFVSRGEPENLHEILAAARSHATLAVGESEGFASRGGIINFITKKKKLRFEINPDAARDAGLKISSRLLGLAVLVQEEH